jgi:hypothetical protein
MSRRKYAYASFNRFEIRLKIDDALSVSHSGQCDDDVAALLRVDYVAKQLDKIDPAAIAAELREYGAWDDEQLADHDDNLARILWIAGGNIREEQVQLS